MRGGILNSYAALVPLRIAAALLPRRVALGLAPHPFARFLVDFLYLPRWRPEWVIVDGLLPPPPFVLTGAHEGHWEIGGVAIAMHVPLTVLVQDHPDRRLLRFREETRARFGIETVVDRPGSFARLLHALRSGRGVAMLVDRDPRAPRSAAALARRARCPLLSAGNDALAGGRYRLRIRPKVLPPLDVLRRGVIGS